MPQWFRPVTRVGDVVVVGEQHRKASSRELVKDVWEDHSFDAVCVEVCPSDVAGWRDDRGGAIGWSLRQAEKSNISRYYVDTPDDERAEAFGGRISAYRYLSGLRDRVPTHEEGLADEATIQETREEIRDRCGEKASWLVLEKRERLMARRAKWVAENTDGAVLLVVGAGHQQAIVVRLRSGVDASEMDRRRRRTGERIRGGPLTVMMIVTSRELKRAFQSVDWSVVQKRFAFWS